MKENRTHNLSFFNPLTLLNGPYFDFASEACACCFKAILTRHDVMTPELMDVLEGLLKGEVGLASGVDFEG